MVKSKDEILASIKSRLGEDTSDEAIALVEDINDSFDDLTTRVNEAGDWKQKYEENDAAWKKKYRDRFYARVEEEDVEDKTPETKKKTFNDLFKDGE